jgi:hypothetical protein
MFTVDRITIYHWLNAWEQHQFPGGCNSHIDVRLYPCAHLTQ